MRIGGEVKTFIDALEYMIYKGDVPFHEWSPDTVAEATDDNDSGAFGRSYLTVLTTICS